MMVCVKILATIICYGIGTIVFFAAYVRLMIVYEILSKGKNYIIWRKSNV